MLWRHARDRRVPTATSIRLVLCTLVALAPMLVGVPTQHEPVPVAYFLPLIFGSLGAMSLGEHVQWLRPRNRRLWLYRGSVTIVPDAACLAGLIVTLDGHRELSGVFAGALLAMSAGMAVACLAQELAWLGAALIGFACLLSFDQAAILYLPVDGSIVVYLITVVVYAVRGPQPRL